MLLALLGIYSVIAFSTALRTQEMAIRLALGSQRSGVMRMVLVSGVKLGVAGCGIGAVAAIFMTRLLRSLLFEVDALDPLVLLLGDSLYSSTSHRGLCDSGPPSRIHRTLEALANGVACGSRLPAFGQQLLQVRASWCQLLLYFLQKNKPKPTGSNNHYEKDANRNCSQGGRFIPNHRNDGVELSLHPA